MSAIDPAPSARWPIVATIAVPLASSLVGLLGGLGLLRSVEPLHNAVAIVGPADPVSDSPATDGPVLAGAPVPPFLRAVELLSGGVLADDLAREPGLLPAVLGEGRGAGSAFTDAARLIAAMAGRQPGDRPDADRLRSHLRVRFRIEATAQPGLRRITYGHRDPAVARLVIASAVRRVDGHLRHAAQVQSEALVAHVRSRLVDRRATEDDRRALAGLLRGEERRLLLLSADVPYAVAFVAGPTTGLRPDDPDPAVVLVIASLAGFVAGLVALRLRRDDPSP